MFAYVIRRIFSGVVMLAIMTLVTMFLFFASPTDAARQACGKNCSAEQIADVRRSLGYDKPVLVQWGNFLKGVAVGREYPDDPELRAAAPELVTKCDAPCLGYSHVASDVVNNKVFDSLPVTASLAGLAFILWIIVGVGLGIIAALRKGTLVDRGIVGLSLIFYAFPTFFIGKTLLIYPAIKWQIVDVPSYTPIDELGVWFWFKSLFLPALTLALVYIAGYVRLTRAFVLESMTEDYLRTARAKGLKRFTVLAKHTMRAALTPLVTIAGLDLAGLLGGAIITETLFNYDGLGKLAVNSARSNDLPMMVGIVVLAASFIIIANIVVDILYAVIDPRVKYS